MVVSAWVAEILGTDTRASDTRPTHMVLTNSFSKSACGVHRPGRLPCCLILHDNAQLIWVYKIYLCSFCSLYSASEAPSSARLPADCRLRAEHFPLECGSRKRCPLVLALARCLRFWKQRAGRLESAQAMTGAGDQARRAWRDDRLGGVPSADPGGQRFHLRRTVRHVRDLHAGLHA